MAIEGEGRRWWSGVDEMVLVVGLRIRKREAREGAGGPKPTKPSMMARFRACRVKRQWRVMGGGGGVVRMKWWWRWGRVFANARRERGLGAKNHETEHDGSISGAPRETTAEGDGGRW
jgi:hypothetical protein